MAVLSAGNSPLELAAATDAGVGFNVEFIIHAQYLLAAESVNCDKDVKYLGAGLS